MNSGGEGSLPTIRRSPGSCGRRLSHRIGSDDSSRLPTVNTEALCTRASAGNILPTGPDQLWVADLTYIRLQKEFVFLAVLLDAWSRKVVGYALSRYLDARLTLAALDAAVVSRCPGPGLIHHSDCGSQYAAKQYRERLEALEKNGSMGRSGNPYDNAKVESFFKTLKQEEVYAFEYETMQDLLERLPTFLEEIYNRRRLHSSLGYVPPEEFELVYAKTEGQIPEPCLST